MSLKVIKGSKNLGEKIRSRRNEFGLTIEEAASKAGVGTKTWSRYESGESIRRDKVSGICKALNWKTFPDEADEVEEIDINEYKKSELWSKPLAELYGEIAALSFVIGSDILLDDIDEDLTGLSSKPRGTHIGELGFSLLERILPPQFLTRYDYEFLYCMRSSLIAFRKQAKLDIIFVAHSVLDELVLYLVVEESEMLIETMLPQIYQEDDLDDYWKDWVFDLLGNSDSVDNLYSDYFIQEDNGFHFDHWQSKQFG